jgi:hypothetical protein
MGNVLYAGSICAIVRHQSWQVTLSSEAEWGSHDFALCSFEL